MNKYELARGREFSVYGRLMDAATAQKLKDITPWIKSGTIVDAGIGTGAVLDALSKKFPRSRLVGVDASRHFASSAKEKFRGNSKIEIIYADLKNPVLPDNIADTAIFSAVLHELYSYNNYSIKAVIRAIKNARRALRPGGRLIIRDGVRPEPKKIYLWLKSEDGIQKAFQKFTREFKNGRGVKYETRNENGKILYQMDIATAYEFLSKKDYKENWKLEINEEFGYQTLADYKKLLRKMGFGITIAREFRNPWIIKNRWRGQAEIFERRNGKLRIIKFPCTNLLIAASKKIS